MKKGIKIFCKVLSVFLAVLFVIEILPLQVMAEEFTDAVAQKEFIEDLVNNPTDAEKDAESEILYEVEEKRDEHTKVYKKSDGTYTAVMTEEPLHYLDESVWKEIDNSMILDGSLYTNLNNLFNVELPKNIDENKELTVEKDGYELSFSIDDIKNSSAIVENDIVASETEIADANSAIAQTQSSVTYNNIADNTDLQYIVTPNSIKENIIISNKESVKDTYTFTFETNGLNAEKQYDGSVLFKDNNGDVKFTIPRPVMTDANFAFSYDFGVLLTANANGTITLEYAPSIDWTSSTDRAYPIVIDPAIVVEMRDSGWVEDTNVMYVSTDEDSVNENHYGEGGGFVGNKTFEDGDTFIGEVYTKINVDDIKALGTNVVVTEAQYLFNSLSFGGCALAKKILEPIELTTVTYATKPNLETESFDYCQSPFEEGDTYTETYTHFNITEPLNDWINGEVNYGFAVVAGNEGYYGLYAMNSTTSSNTNTTIMVLDFVDVAGNNSYFDYHSQSAGRAGTGYVSDFTQSLSVIRDDLSIDGNIMPTTISMIYCSSILNILEVLEAENMQVYGNGWVPECLRTFIVYSEDRLIYYTDTGATIEFSYSENEDGELVFTETYGDIYGESGYTIEHLSTDDYGQISIKVTRPDGYVEVYNSANLLEYIYNPDYPEQKVSYIYETVISEDSEYARIDYITDGVGRKYDYVYDNTTGLLSKVKCYSASGTEILAGTTNLPLEVRYTYDENENLTNVTYPDGKSITYEYNNGNMTSMTNIDGYRVKYDYDSNGRITKVTEQAYDGTNYVDGNHITYDRLSSTQIKLTDGIGNSETYQFNRYGKLLYTIDSYGNYIMNEDSGSTDETYFISSSDYRVNSENLLLNPSFETEYNALSTSRAKYWENSAFDRTSSTDAYFGEYVYTATRDTLGDAYQKQTVDVLSGGKYTFSAYVKSDEANTGKLYLNISARNGSNTVKATDYVTVENTNGEWQRYSVTINAPADVKDIIVKFGFEDSKGTFYIDNVQLSQSASASPYNYITDGGFRKDLDYWTGSEDFTTTESSINGEVANAVTLPGGTNTENTVYQTVTINGKKDDVFTVGGWLKAQFVNSSTSNAYILQEIEESTNPNVFNFTNDRYAQIEVSYQYTETNEEGVEETLTETIVVPFAENIENWQFAAQDFALKGDCETVTVLVRYSKHAQTALISNIELSKDEDAVVINDDEEETTEEETKTCPCEACEEADCTCTCESEALCGCVPCKRRSDISTTDSFGNITSSNSFDGVKTIETLSNYTADGNYLASETDADGNTVTYDYNTLNGILTAITDANGNKTSYSYDANGLLTQVSADNSLTSSANYVYNNDRLVSITHNGFSYNLSYDIWGQLTQVSVGTQPIISYEYGVQQYRDRILSSTYHNGEDTETEYTYDETGNIIEICVNGETKFEYDYDSYGNVTEITASGSRTIRYYDDRTDILDINDNLIYSSYTNDDGDLIEVINGVTYTSKSYDSAYDIATGITTEFSDVSASNGKVIGTVDKQDWFGRYTESVVKTEGAKDESSENNFASVKTEYTYPEYADNKTSNRIESYLNTITYGTDTSAENKTDYYGFAYDYDNNGNIIAEYKQGVNGAKTLRYSYVYDELNQLVRVNDKVSNTTYTYTYDGAGNIVSKAEYIYTTDETITDEAEKVTNYTYDTVWKDKLATYDGKAFTYDNIGNPLTFDGATFSWSGRELTQYEKDGKTISFQYDENGLRHRKTVSENGVITEQYDYVWSDGTLISQTYTDLEDGTVVSTDTARFIYDSWGTLQGFILNDSETYLYVKNLQGDIIAIVDELGEVIFEYSYDAWGNVTFHETSLQNMTKASTLCFVSPFTYRGYCYDYDIELYYLQSRYYSAEIGRFINTDDTQIAIATQGELLGANLFAYCENNPVINVDFTGTIAANVVGAVIGTVIGVVGGYFLAKWLAGKINFKYNWQRNAFIGGLTALVTASAAAIGYFIGPYVAKIATKLANYVLELLQNGKIAFQKLSKNAKSAIRSIGKLGCFVEGTPVLTSNGKVPIESLSVGDLVWSENPKTGECGWKAITQIFVKTTNILVTIKIDSQEIITTEEHPFWVVGKGWTKAAFLRQGDLLKLSNGDSLQISKVDVEYTSTPVVVYNFEVEDWHTYFVGSESILVHNQCAKDFVKASRTPKEVVKFLKKHGFKEVSQKGSHLKLTDGLHTTTVPMHSKDLGKGLLKEILKQAGLL